MSNIIILYLSYSQGLNIFYCRQIKLGGNVTKKYFSSILFDFLKKLRRILLSSLIIFQIKYLN